MEWIRHCANDFVCLFFFFLKIKELILIFKLLLAKNHLKYIEMCPFHWILYTWLKFSSFYDCTDQVREVIHHYRFKFLALSSPSGTHMMQISVCLTLPQTVLMLSSFWWILVPFPCSDWVFSASFSSQSLIWSSTVDFL